MIVTFTTVPPRFAHLGAVLRAMESQIHRPEAVELYIPRSYRRFPGQVPALPDLPGWLNVISTDHDHGPATKILPALQRWQGRGVDLLFCDDDKAYDPGWTARFAGLRRDHPEDALCEYGRELEHVTRTPALARSAPPGPRAVLMPPHPKGTTPVRHFQSPGHMDAVYGFAGVMIREGWLDARAFAIPDILWTVDDIWLSGMLELQGRRIWVGDGGPWLAGPTDTGRIAALRDHHEQGHDRFAANRACVHYFRDTYGIWK